MCGVAGIVCRPGTYTPEVLRNRIETMTHSLRPRGPDDWGVWIDPPTGVALGHQRLSIMDTSQEGHQPMLSPSGRYVVVYNGEIYNFQPLSAQLRQRGHSFRGHSDTEVAVAAFDEFGIEDAVTKFNGMFAFAIWDRTEQQLILVRDRIGIKPLYFGLLQGMVLFGSELRALLTVPEFSPTISVPSLGLFLRHGYISGEYSIFQDVHKVTPGTIVRLSPKSLGETKSVQSTCYWNAVSIAKQAQRNLRPIHWDDATTLVQEALQHSVRARMISDVPLGAFLSGGLDSTTVVALMAAASSDPIKTFYHRIQRSGVE